MSGPLGLLLGLLLLAYLGSALSTSSAQRLFGLPSGAEYLALGFVLGPVALGVIERGWIETFAPILAVGSAWLALIAGLDCGRVSRPDVVMRMGFGVVLTALVAGGVATVLWFALDSFGDFPAENRSLLALAVAAVGCATTQHALRWTISGLRSRGLLSATLLDLSRASPLIPAVLLSLVAGSESGSRVQFFGWQRVGIGFGIGIVLGSLAALLLGREFRRAESWGVLLGVSLLACGVTAGLGLSGVAAMFVIGLTLGLISEHRDEIRAMILPTERPVVLPVALMLGASINPTTFNYVLPLAGLTVLTRGALELLRGATICAGVRHARPAGIWVGLSFTSAGSFTLAACAELSLHLRGITSDVALTAGAVVLIVGEIVGPAFLRRALSKAGDVPSLQADGPAPSSVQGGVS